MRRICLVICLLAVPAPVLAGGDQYVVVQDRTLLHAKPDSGAGSVKSYAERPLRVVGRRGDWFEVDLELGQGAHCSRSQGGKANVRLRLFVRVRDALPVTRRATHRRFPDGSSIHLDKGFVVHPTIPRNVANLARSAGVRATYRPIKRGLIGGRGAPVYIRRSTRLEVGSEIFPLRPYTRVEIKRRSATRVLVQQRSRCHRLTGWIPAAALERPKPKGDELGGVEGGVEGGVVGGVLGGPAPGRRRPWLRLGTTLYWPDGTVAGVAARDLNLYRKLQTRGRRTCSKLRPAWDLSETTLCFGSTDIDWRKPRLGNLLGRGLPPPPPPPPPPSLKIVPQHTLESLRIAGNKQILPPKAVKLAMAERGQRRLVSTWKLCVSRAGTVDRALPLKSSGYITYDLRIRAELRRWRYRPFMVNGRATPVCTAVTFIYRQH